jgi:hypothetical protein
MGRIWVSALPDNQALWHRGLAQIGWKLVTAVIGALPTSRLGQSISSTIFRASRLAAPSTLTNHLFGLSGCSQQGDRESHQDGANRQVRAECSDVAAKRIVQLIALQLPRQMQRCVLPGGFAEDHRILIAK